MLEISHTWRNVNFWSPSLWAIPQLNQSCPNLAFSLQTFQKLLSLRSLWWNQRNWKKAEALGKQLVWQGTSLRRTSAWRCPLRRSYMSRAHPFGHQRGCTMQLKWSMWQKTQRWPARPNPTTAQLQHSQVQFGGTAVTCFWRQWPVGLCLLLLDSTALGSQQKWDRHWVLQQGELKDASKHLKEMVSTI